jgi:phosphoribosyl 1,2-cyclic phosphodiesterase
VLEFSVLSSGSSGNAIYIRTGNTKILLDAGISAKQIQNRLQEVTQDHIKDIDALLLTHEHIDHVRSVRQVTKLSQAQVYTTEGTWHHVKDDVEGAISKDKVNFVKSDASFRVGDILVTPFSVSHDADEPVAYRFDAHGHSLAVLTDLGYVSDHIKSIVQGCQTYVWEANHDVGMLRAGRYPWSVKRRILGDKGHLSNEDAAVALGDILGNDPVQVYLAHLSDETNQPDLAELTVQSVLHEMKAQYGEQVSLHRTSRTNPTPLRTSSSFPV